MEDAKTSDPEYNSVPINEPKPLDELDLNLGIGTVNALTFRSFVSPKEARPDISYYQVDGTQRKRGSYGRAQMPSFRIASSRCLFGEDDDPTENNGKKQASPKKFGPWDGVCTSCLLNIFGVIMFLRLGWVVGQVGVPLSLVIIGISTVVTTLTTFSMAAICTNGKVKEGGAYFLISRAIGPNIGGAIGFLFSLGLSVAVAMYVIGFCETLSAQLESVGFSLTGDTLWDIRIYGLIVLFINFVMTMIGTDWVIKMQIGLLMLLVGAIVTFMIGTFANPTDLSNGIVGYGSGIISKNLVPEYKEGYDFFSVFGVFFPAVTGIMAGANISGDLRNPSNDIPLGTITAIVVSTIVYGGMAIMCGAVAQRTVGDSTKAGLIFDTLIMVKLSVLKGVVVIIGIYAATFSSSLASLVGAPRVLQRLAKDGIIPFLDYFSVVRARDGAPVRGYVFSTIVAGGCILIGELNLVAPLITMFFMLTYGLINFSCCALALSKAPGWRPTFRYFTWWSSAIGAVLCLVIMFLTSVVYALVSFAVGWAIYKYVQYKAVNVNWGSAFEARKDRATLKGLMKLRNVQDHVKTFRPHYLVLTGHPPSRMWLIKLTETLYHGYGAVIYGNVIRTTFDKYFSVDIPSVTINGAVEASTPDICLGKSVDALERSSTAIPDLRKGYWFDSNKNNKRTAGFLDTVISEDFRRGCQSLLLLGGVGRFRPNILLLGYPVTWTDSDSAEVTAYTNTIKDTFRLGLSVMIARGFKHVNFDRTPSQLKECGGTLDVWWLADDGGLTILVCYLFLQHNFWKYQIKKVNIYVVVGSSIKMEGLQILLTQLISKFRVKFGTSVNWEPIPVVAKPLEPQQQSIDKYNSLSATCIDDESKTRKHIIHRWIRVSELISQYSEAANLIVCLMPFPRASGKGQDYLAILEMLSTNNCPTILMRGNGENCMTFEME